MTHWELQEVRGFGARSGLISLLLEMRRQLKIETERPRREESQRWSFEADFQPGSVCPPGCTGAAG